MKQQLIKTTLAAALGLGLSAAAQAQIANNDLVLGFTSPTAASVGGSQFDYVINLGQLLGTGAHQITLSGSQYDNTTFVTDLGSAATSGGLFTGVWGGKPGSSGDVLVSAVGQPATASKAFEAQAAGLATGVALGSVSQTTAGGNSVHQSISTAPGQPGSAGVASSFGGVLQSPLTTVSSSQGTGGSVVNMEVWESTYPFSGNAAAFTDQGFVSILFGADGGIGAVAWDQDAALTPVPEPTYGLFGGLGVLLFALRRQFKSKIA